MFFLLSLFLLIASYVGSTSVLLEALHREIGKLTDRQINRYKTQTDRQGDKKEKKKERKKAKKKVTVAKN